MRYLSENKREDMRMKKRTAARSMAALMGAAMVLTACGQHHKLKEKMERNLFAGSFHCVKI